MFELSDFLSDIYYIFNYYYYNRIAKSTNQFYLIKTKWKKRKTGISGHTTIS